MDLRQLDRGELVAVLGGAVLGVSVFLAWFMLGDKYTVLGSCRGPNTACTAWKSLMIIRYPGTDGVKTGYTHVAGQCLVAAARRGRTWLGVVLLRSANTLVQAQTLLGAGFTKFGTRGLSAAPS